MKLQLLHVLFSTTTLAYPHLVEISERQVDPADHQWIPAANVPGAVRCGCPGTNTLANHGYINRDGKNITAQMYMQGFLDAFGMGATGTAFGAQNALNLCTALTGKNCTSFNLDMMNTPHAIEHDASLSRIDYDMRWNSSADNHDFNSTVFMNTMHAWRVGNPNATHLNLTMANTARTWRQHQAARRDAPGWYVNDIGNTISENAFILSTMNDPALGQDYLTNPQARIDWINHWFSYEQLPTALGWTRTATSISTPSILAQSVLSAATYTVHPCKGGFGNCMPFSGSIAIPTPNIVASEDSVNDPTPHKYSPLPSGTKFVRKVRRAPQETGAAAASDLASSSAAAAAGPKPTFPNAFAEEISPEQFLAMGAQAEAYKTRYRAAYTRALNMYKPTPT